MTRPEKKSHLKVFILTGGITDESYLSYRSASHVIKYLDLKRYDYRVLDWQRDGTVACSEWNRIDSIQFTYPSLAECLVNRKDFEILLNLLHGNSEGDGRLNGLYEFADIAYTGNGYLPCFCGMHKFQTKLLFEYYRIPTAPFVVVHKYQRDRLSVENALFNTFPCMVKPNASGSSIGIKKVSSPQQLYQHVAALLLEHEQVIIEQFTSGLDLAVGVINLAPNQPQVLPPALIEYKSDYFDEEVKRSGRYEKNFNHQLPAELISQAQDYALRIHQKLHFDTISRTDFMVNPHTGELFALEINTHPGLSEKSIMTAMLQHAGIPMSRLIESMIEGGLHRKTNYPG